MVLDWKWFRRSERRGFSLIEIAAFISIFTVMTYYAGAVTGQGFKSLRKVKDHSAACNLARAQLEAITFSQGDQTIAYDPVLRPELKINNIEYSVTIKATPNINGDAQLKRFDVTVNWRNAVNGAKGAYTLATYISSYPRVVPAGRLVTITNRNSYALTDHQVLLTVNTRAFVSAGTMRSDGNDIRFYDPEGNPLPYWIEEDPLAANGTTMNTAQTRIWIKVRNIPVGDSKIYFDYGNKANTKPGSNGTETFEFFDDFSNQASFNSKWVVVGGYCALSSGRLYVWGGNRNWGSGLYSRVNIARPCTFEYTRIRAGGNYCMFGFKDSSGGIHHTNFVYAAYTVHDSNGHRMQIYENNNYRGDYKRYIHDSRWEYWKIDALAGGGAQYYLGWYCQQYSPYYSSGYSSASPLKVGFSNYNQAFYLDNARVRKSAPHEPVTCLDDFPWTTFAWRDIVTVYNRSGAARSGYQVLLTVNTASLISAGRMVSDGRDIRFRDTAGRNLPYWIEDEPASATTLRSTINSASTRIWIRLASMPAGVSRIFMDYGNPGVWPQSSGARTFDYWQDGLWFACGGSDWNSGFASTPGFARPFVIEYARLRNGGNYSMIGAHNNGYGVHHTALNYAAYTVHDSNGHRMQIYENNNYRGDYKRYIHDARWEFWRQDVLTAGAQYYLGWYPQQYSPYYSSGYNGDSPLKVGLSNYNMSFSVNALRVRKLVTPEPILTLTRDAGAEFKYRDSYTIENNSGSVLSEYQVLVQVDTAALISAGKMRSNGGDIRFKDAADNYLPYWIESELDTATTLRSTINTDHTRIWVRVPSVPTGKSVIYMDYGNNSVLPASNGELTFDYWDDGLWFACGGRDWNSGFASTQNFQRPFIMEYMRLRNGGNYSMMGGHNTGYGIHHTNLIYAAYTVHDSNGHRMQIYENNNYRGDYQRYIHDVRWEYWKLDIMPNAGAQYYQGFWPGNYIPYYYTGYNSDTWLKVGMSNYNMSFSVNALRVRKYAYPEPLVYLTPPAETVSDFPYLRPITVTNYGGGLSDFQVMLTMNTASLVAAGQMRSDGRDIRFSTSATSASWLPYWIEPDPTQAGSTTMNKTNTRIWIRLPSVPAGKSKIYMRYGNPKASPLAFFRGCQNGDKTFLFYDNFAPYEPPRASQYGSSGLPDWYGWQMSGYTTYGSLYVSGAASDWQSGLASRRAFARPFVFEFARIRTGGNYAMFGIRQNANAPHHTYLNYAAYTVHDSNGHRMQLYENNNYRGDYKRYIHDNRWEFWKVEALPNAGAQYYLGWYAQKYSPYYSSGYSSDAYMKVGFSNYNQAFYFAYPRVRRYAVTEPVLTLDDPAGAVFPYRMQLTIRNSTGAELSQYQVMVVVNTASLISAGRMRSKGEDIRFRDASGNDLPYWIEPDDAATGFSGINTSNTRIWVRVPSVPAGSSTIYMDYGNNSVLPASNGELTFDFWDDGLWFACGGRDWNSGFASTKNFQRPFIVEYARLRNGGNYSMMGGHNTGYGIHHTNLIYAAYTVHDSNGHRMQIYENNNYRGDYQRYIHDVRWEYWKLDIMPNAGAQYYQGFWPGNYIPYYYTGYNSDTWLKVGMSNYNMSFSVNALRVRKYAYPEPSVYQTPPSEAVSDFAYHRPVTITNYSGAALSDFQVMLTVNTASLVASGHMRSDGRDIRFSASASSASWLPYWIEEDPLATNGTTMNTSTTRIWIRVPSIPAGKSTIFMHHGDPNASALAYYRGCNNGSRTFLLFDDFDKGGLSKWFGWQMSGYTTGGVLLVSGAASDWQSGLASRNSFARPFVFEFARIRTGGNYAMFGIRQNSNAPHHTYLNYAAYAVHDSNGHRLQLYENNYYRGDYKRYIHDNRWEFWKIEALPNAGAQYYLGWNSQRYSPYYSSGYKSDTIMKVGFSNYNQAFYFTHARVRRYSVVEPVVTLGEPVPVVYNYRTPIRITNSTSSVLSNHQVLVKVNTAALLSAGKLRADGQGLRFADGAGNLLPFWIETNYTTGFNLNDSGTRIWVRVPSIARGNSTVIYMYYNNNASMIPQSNGELTFDYWDDRLWFACGGNDWNSGFASARSFTRPFIMEYARSRNGGNYSMWGPHDNNFTVHHTSLTYAAYAVHDSNGHRIQVYENNNYRGDYKRNINATAWEYWRQDVLPGAGCNYYHAYTLGVFSMYYSSGYSSASPLKVGMSNYNTSFSVNALRVRRYASPEPSAGLLPEQSGSWHIQASP